MMKFKDKIIFAALLIVYLVTFLIAVSHPLISLISITFCLFLFLCLALMDKGVIDFNNLHKRDGFGCSIFILFTMFVPVYFFIFIGFSRGN